jgi:ABC-type multidrug transport system ATPase subunit
MSSVLPSQAKEQEEERFELEVVGLSVCRGPWRKRKLILDDVTFSVKPGRLTGVIGPNGAGKTTLMRSLAGERPDCGQLLINGEDMYDDPEYWLQRIGYVPDHNVLHEHLTMSEALVYLGQLRCPNLTLRDVQQKVDSLLTEFGFEPADSSRHKQIRQLSNGQRKRANICAELISDPPILMLDEPTSGLDPDAEWFLMELLARYAHNHWQTILVITHTLNTVHFCDDIVFLENAHNRASGPHETLLAGLEAQISLAQEAGAGSRESGQVGTRPAGEETAGTFFRWSEVFKQYRTRGEPEPCPGKWHGGLRRERHGRSNRLTPTPWFHQLALLLGRYVRERLGDRMSLIGTLLAGLSGALFFVLPAKTFVKPFDPAEVPLALNQARQSTYLVAIVVALIGLITSYTEIAKEFHIYRHERKKGLSPSAYFASKWLLLAAAVGVLAPILLMSFLVLVYGQPLPGFDQPRPEFGEVVGRWEYLVRFQLLGLVTSKASWLILTTLVLACVAAVTLGLLISAVTADGGKGYLYLSFVVVFVVLFSGLIRNVSLEQLIETLAFASTGKWGYEGVASSLGIYCWLDGWRFDEFNSTGRMVSIWLALAAYALVAAFLAIMALRLRDPWHGLLMNLRRLLCRDWAKVAVCLSVLVLLLSYTLFLRQGSQEYHSLTYWSQGRYGGSNAYEYATIQEAQDPDLFQLWYGKLSQSWCGSP